MGKSAKQTENGESWDSSLFSVEFMTPSEIIEKYGFLFFNDEDVLKLKRWQTKH